MHCACMDDDKVISIIPECEGHGVGVAAKEQLFFKKKKNQPYFSELQGKRGENSLQWE